MKSFYSYIKLSFIILILTSCRYKEKIVTITKEDISFNLDSAMQGSIDPNIYSAFSKAFNIDLKLKLIDNDSIEYTHTDRVILSNGLNINKIRFNAYSELIPPSGHYYPYKDSISSQIEFIIASYEDPDANYPLNIAFQNGQTFLYGKDYTLLTKKMKASEGLDDFDDKSFLSPNMNTNSNTQYLLHTKNKKYFLSIFPDGPWWIHHLFDISDKNDIRYYILYSIYTMEDGYFVDKDGKLKFRQKYFYLRNSEDTSQDKYRIIDIP